MEGIDQSHTAIIDRANPVFYLAAVGLVFFTLLTPSWPVVVLWSCGLAVLGAYLFFRNRCLVPNLLIHLKPVSYQDSEDKEIDKNKCQVCGNMLCKRHVGGPSTTMPWEGMLVPKTIDSTLSEFLEIILTRFVTSWHSGLTDSHAFTNDLRSIIRHGVCVVLNRAAMIDIPKMVTGPLMHCVAEHIDVYLKVKRRMPPSATLEQIREQVWLALGSKLHVGIRGQMSDLAYFRNLTRCALPLLLPHGTAESRALNLFLEELFASKVMIPTMNYVSTPDFLNKILILIFDKESKLVRMIGPQSEMVPFLQSFATPKKRNKLQVPINHLIKSQRLLYPFIQFLKKNGGIHMLQFYLSCNELRKNIAKLDFVSLQEKEALTNLDQIGRLYNIYMCETAENRIHFNPLHVSRMEQILAADYPCELKLMQLMDYRLLDLACNSVLVTLERFFCPQFFHSEQYHDSMMPILTSMSSKRYSLYSDTSSISRHFEKWRRQRKKVFSSSQAQDGVQNSLKVQDLSHSVGTAPSPVPTRLRSDSLSSNPAAESFEETVVVSAPSYVQIVDWEIINTGIKPFTIYTIVSRVGEGDDKIVYTVRRRYKEFNVLDTRIHQFYHDIAVHLPPKKTIKNMEKEFIESRAAELDKYLKKLIKEPEVQSSQLLRSFLTETADISLFMPNTMGDKAGKIIKSVPNILKKETKGQHLENLLQAMELSIATGPRSFCPEKRAHTEEMMAQNEATIREYQQALQADQLHSETNKSLSSPSEKTGTEVTLNGVMDLLVYLAIHVYGVSQAQLAALLVIKMLGQNSIEAYIHHLLSNRIELILMENKACELIKLLQTNLFFDDSPPRTAEDKMQRLNEATATILNRPPAFLIDLIGRESFESNTQLLIEGMQDPMLNKQMLFSMLDIVLYELFPELRTTGT